MATTEPIRNKRDIKLLANYYFTRGQTRNYVLIVLGLHTALRIGDLLRLRWSDVLDENGALNRSITLTEQKTKKAKTIALNDAVLRALGIYLSELDRDGTRREFIFSNSRKNPAAICRVTAWRIIRAAAEALEIAGIISCHSLRKTFGYHCWRSGVPAALLMDIFNHSSFEITRRYLGICQDDRDKVYLGLSLL
jgi:integrase